MVDKNTFMETVRLVQEVAKTSQEPMGKDEMMSYFKDMDLSSEQEEMVYQFFIRLPQEQVESEERVELGEDAEPEEDIGSEDSIESTRFRMYLDEVNEIIELGDETEARLYQSLRSGDTSVIAAISTQWLKRVIAIAEEYKDRGYLLDDLVQEGNMGLLMELHAVAEKASGQLNQMKKPGLAEPYTEGIHKQLKEAVKNAIEQYIGEESSEEQQNESILGKVSLVHAAQKFLAEEKGEKPSMQELAEYTKIPVEEIMDILSLVKEK